MASSNFRTLGLLNGCLQILLFTFVVCIPAYGTYVGGMWPTTDNSTYAFAYVDEDEAVLNGANRYRLRFDADRIPPATAYEVGTFDLYPNSHEKYVVGSNHPSTRFGEDGSVEILLAHEQPETLAQNVNWIPVPKGEFLLAIRFYAPTPEVLSFEYETPALERWE